MTHLRDLIDLLRVECTWVWNGLRRKDSGGLGKYVTFDLERVPPVESIQMYLCKGLDFERGEKPKNCLSSLLCHSRSLLVERHVFHELYVKKQELATYVAPIAGVMTITWEEF